jgi:hypothetical protein
MFMVQLDVRGLEETTEALRRLGTTLGTNAINEALDQAGRSVAREFADEVARMVPALAKPLRSRIYWWGRNGVGYLRFHGTGKRGKGFIRPRHLGLDRPKIGMFMNRKPRFGAPFTTFPALREYRLGFIMVPGKGTKTSGKGTPRGGRTMRPWDGNKADRARAVLFRRIGPSRYPIDSVPGLRLAEVVDIVPLVETAELLLPLRFQLELEQRVGSVLEQMKIVGWQAA